MRKKGYIGSGELRIEFLCGKCNHLSHYLIIGNKINKKFKCLNCDKELTKGKLPE